MQWQVKVVYSRTHQTLNLDALGFKGIVIHLPRDIKQLVENDGQPAEGKRHDEPIPCPEPECGTELEVHSHQRGTRYLGKLDQAGTQSIPRPPRTIRGHTYIKLSLIHI